MYWFPLGAGGHFVRLNGRVYEALASRLQRRPALDLYHSALQVELPEGTFVIEQAPVHDWSGQERGVVADVPGEIGVDGLAGDGGFRLGGEEKAAEGDGIEDRGRGLMGV